MTDLSTLLTQVSEVLSQQGGVVGANSDFYAGRVDDPDSFDAQGAKVGPRGYYPLTLANGSTIYFPCMARLIGIAPEALAQLAIVTQALGLNPDIASVITAQLAGRATNAALTSETARAVSVETDHNQRLGTIEAAQQVYVDSFVDLQAADADQGVKILAIETTLPLHNARLVAFEDAQTLYGQSFFALQQDSVSQAVRLGLIENAQATYVQSFLDLQQADTAQGQLITALQEAMTSKVSKSGGIMTGLLQVPRITNLGDPLGPYDALRFGFAESRYYRRDADGNLVVGGQIKGVDYATEPQSAVPLAQMEATLDVVLGDQPVAGEPWYARKARRPIPCPSYMHRLLHVPVLGQSQASNTLNVGGAGIDLMPLDPTRAFMFVGGWPTADISSPDNVAPRAGMSTLVPLKDLASSVTASRFAHRLVPSLAVDDVLLCSCHAVPGQPYYALKEGTQPFSNMIAGLRAAAAAVDLLDMEYWVLLFVLVHGESMYLYSAGEYLNVLDEWQTASDEAARRVDNRAVEHPFLMFQPATWTRYKDQQNNYLTRSEIPIAMATAAAVQPMRFLLGGPSYQYSYATNAEDQGYHKTNLGYQRAQQDLGRWADAYYTFGSWLPLGLGVTAARAGTTVTVTCPKPAIAAAGWKAPLAINTADVSDPGNYGLSFVDTAGEAVALSNIQLVPGQDNQFRFTLARATGGTLRMGTVGTPGANAGPTTGPRTCFRGQQSDSYADGPPAYDWMICNEIACA